MISAIIAAGGKGKRFGGDKQLAELEGYPILLYSISKFLSSQLINEVIVVTTNDRAAVIKKYLDMDKVKKKLLFAEPGDERYDSIYNGVVLSSNNILCIHDGARPFVTEEMIKKSYDAIINGYNASFIATPVVNTLRKVEDGIVRTISRKNVFNVLTPQFVYKEDWLEAYSLIKSNSISVTDDIQMLEEIYKYKSKRLRVKEIVTNESVYNIKVTYKTDLSLAKLFVLKVPICKDVLKN